MQYCKPVFSGHYSNWYCKYGKGKCVEYDRGNDCRVLSKAITLVSFVTGLTTRRFASIRGYWTPTRWAQLSSQAPCQWTLRHLLRAGVTQECHHWWYRAWAVGENTTEPKWRSSRSVVLCCVGVRKRNGRVDDGRLPRRNTCLGVSLWTP